MRGQIDMGQFSFVSNQPEAHTAIAIYSLHYMALIADGIVSITKSVGVKRIVSPYNDQLGKETKRIDVVTIGDRDYSRKPIERFRVTSAAGSAGSLFMDRDYFFLHSTSHFSSFFYVSFSHNF
jgi:hypothetical protein